MHRLRCVAILFGLFLAACEDDTTGPSTDLRLAAWTFDALSRARIDVGDGDGAIAASNAALALRAGIRPTRVRITVDGVTEDYLALETEHAFGDDPPAGLLFSPQIVWRTMIAWRGGSPHRFVAIGVFGDTSVFTPFRLLAVPGASSVIDWMLINGVVFERGGPAFVGVAGGAHSTRESTGAACDIPRGRLFTPPLEPISCHRALFRTRFTMTANELSRLSTGAGSRVVQMDSQDVAGAQFVYPSFPTLCPVCR
jgi:hypothetical protein